MANRRSEVLDYATPQGSDGEGQGCFGKLLSYIYVVFAAMLLLVLFLAWLTWTVGEK